MIFKQVKPFPAFCNGTNLVVEQVNVQSVKDNLVDEVTFKYTLATAEGAWAGEGAYTLGADRYKEWDATDRGAYEIVCAGIKLELLPDVRFAADKVGGAE